MTRNIYPKVSIIIPNYNHGVFLEQRIESILNQTFQDYELIILDDCSKDNSRDIIERYRDNKHISHIEYNTQNSGSPFIQWQKGISLSRGKYIWIAESDDYCDNNLLETLVNVLDRKEKCSFAYCLSKFVDPQNRLIWKSFPEGKDRYVKSQQYLSKYLACDNPVYNVSSALFRKDIAINIPNNYQSYKGSGDKLFWVYMAEYGDVYVVNKLLNSCRIHEQKVTNRKNYDGTNFVEIKHIFDYMVAKGYISSIRKYVVIGYNIYTIKKMEFESNAIRRDLINMWDKGKFGILLYIVGRIYAFIKFHLNVFL